MLAVVSLGAATIVAQAPAATAGTQPDAVAAIGAFAEAGPALGPARSGTRSNRSLEPGQFNADVVRLAGATRFATAARTALGSFPIGVGTVYVATGRNFPDALAAGPVAGMHDAPILLTETDALPDETRRALRMLQPGAVIVLGGASAVSDAVLEQIEKASGVVARRLAGRDRFSTAAAVSAEGFPDGADQVYVATGANFPDALAGGAAGAATGTPMVLVSRDGVPEASAAELRRLDPDQVVVLGGDAAVSDEVLAVIEDLVGVTPTRLAGDTRYATAALISRSAFPDGADGIFLATGRGFPDALAGAPAAARASVPVLLTQPDCVPDEVADEVLRLAPASVTVLGGTAAIGPRAAQLLPCSVDDVVADLVVTIDPTVEPSRSVLTSPDGVDQPLTAFADDEGVVVDLVAGHVVLAGTDSEAAEVAAELSTEVVSSKPIADTGRSLHLFAVGPDALAVAVDADPAALDAVIRSIDPSAQGTLRLPDLDTLALLQAVASLAARGYAIGLNPLMGGDDVATRKIAEAPVTTTGDTAIGGYDPNAFGWDWANGTQTPDTGVTEAWRAIALSGHEIADDSTSRIAIGIIDGGFFDHPDLPRLRRNFDNRTNSGDCGDNNPCPFHGTHVALAATGLIGNGQGAAGVAGQVASPLAFGYGGDLFSALVSLVDYISQTPGILNMSFSVAVPKAAAWLLRPLHLVTGSAAVLGTIIFASAGNDARDVDRSKCVWFVCWETHTVAPCELIAVQCVGGMAPGKHSRDPSSAYGDDDVEFWAPFTVYVGQDPDSSANAARRISGTSFSSPFVAGAAALIRSINPDFTRRTVLDILHATAGQGFGDVTDFVRVDDAVVRALGGNRPFDVTIVSPTDGATTQRDRIVGLRVDVTDPDTTPTVTWRVDGDLVATTSEVELTITPDTFALGTYDATVTVTDGPYQYRRTRQFTVVNTPALGTIRAPDDGDGVPSFFESSSILLDATAFDPDVIGRIPATANIRWRVDGGTVLRHGRSPAALVPADDLGGPGRYLLELLIFEPEAGRLAVVDTVTFDVVADPPDVPPDVDITDPPGASGGEFTGTDGVGRFRDVTFTAAANDPDPEDDAVLLDWSATFSSGDTPPGPSTIAPTGTTATTATFRLYMDGCGTTWSVTVIGTEDDGNDPPVTGQDTTTFKVDVVC
ncbi:MAG TPA: cell wall-binding repeat-containing protein [Nitriliruptorales bacterium]